MHELPITRNIFEIVLKYAKKENVQKVAFVNLEIGALSDLQEKWIQRYFDHLSQHTVVEGARLKINRIPAVFECNKCQRSFQTDKIAIKELNCPDCNSGAVYLISGKEYHIKSMEAF